MHKLAEIKRNKMKNSPPKISDYSLQYGTLQGLIAIAFSFMLFILDQHYQGGTAVNLVNLAIAISVIYLAQIAYKKKNEGYISLSESIKIGLGISLVSGILSILFFLLLSNVLDPEMMDKTLLLVEDRMIESNPKITQQEIDNIIEMTKKFSGPGTSSMFIIIFSLFFGFIISLITGLVIKKTKTE